MAISIIKQNVHKCAVIIVFLGVALVSCTISPVKNNRNVVCDLYLIDSSNKSIKELDFTNKVIQSLKEKLNILDNQKKERSNICELTFKYNITSYSSNISLTGDISNINERIVVSIELKDVNKNFLFKDKIIEFLSIQISNFKYTEMTNKSRIYDEKIESISNKILMSIKRNINL